MSVTVKVEVTKVPRGVLLGGMRPFFNEVMLIAHADVSQAGRVPIDTGNLRNSLSPGGGATMVDPSDPPMWAAVGTRADYGGYLNDPQGRNPHYRDGPSAGQPTRGWLTNTIENVKGPVADALARLATEIEAAHRGAQ